MSAKKASKKTAGAKKKQAKKKAKKRAAPGAVTTRALYTGMSGQFVAMSEFLWRGYNVALPAVDVGEDVFVVEAERGVLRRVQVKTAGTGTLDAPNRKKSVQFKLSRAQLNLPLTGSVLFFMLLARWDDVDPKIPWRFVLIRQDELNTMRLKRAPGVAGRPPAPDSPNASDVVQMKAVFGETNATAWGHSLAPYLDRWSADWPLAGPMRSRPGAAGTAAVSLAAPLAAAAAGAPAAASAAATPAPAVQPPAASSGLGTKST